LDVRCCAHDCLHRPLYCVEEGTVSCKSA